MRNLRRSLSEAGYDQEEAFIYKLEREQAEKKKREQPPPGAQILSLKSGSEAQPTLLPSGIQPLKKAG